MAVHCTGDHEIYVADVVGHESTGSIVVITVCRRCDAVNFHTHMISPGPLRIKSEEKEK